MRRLRTPLAATGLVIVGFAVWPSAAAAAPAVGAWEAHGPSGASATFVIERIRGRLVLDHYVQFCQGVEGNAGDGRLYDGTWPETNSVLKPSYYVNRIGRRGRILPPRQPPGLTEANPVRGRLGFDRGTIVGLLPPVTGGETDPDCGARPRMKAQPVQTTPVRNGVWRLIGPYGTEADVGVLGHGRLIGIGSHSFSGPENVPTGIPQIPFASCGDHGNSNVLPPEDGPGRGGWPVSRSGTFSMHEVDEERGPLYPGGTLSVEGRFDSPTHATGTYRVTRTGRPTPCDSGPLPFEMTFTTPVEEPGGELPPPGPPPPLKYVALGDSFSSGEGVRPYLPGTDVRSNRCHRSTRAYSRRFRFRARRATLTFVACSGATSLNLWQSPPQYPGLPTVQAAVPQLNSATELVTLTIGGNDVDFSSVLKACAMRRVLPRNCTRGRVARRIDAQLATLPARLASAYAAIRARIGAGTAVIVLGYPQLFPADVHFARCPGLTRAFYTRPVQRFLRIAGAKLQRVLSQSAQAARFQFVPMAGAFDGHEVCTRDPWIAPLRLRPRQLIKLRSPLDLGSFHPNAEGQAAYARVLSSYIRRRIRRHAPLTPVGLPANP